MATVCICWLELQRHFKSYPKERLYLQILIAARYSLFVLSYELHTTRDPLVSNTWCRGKPSWPSAFPQEQKNKLIYEMIYLLTAIGLSPGGSTHLHTNNTQNNTNNNRTTQITTNVEECGPCPVFASFTLAFALQLRKNYGKTSVRVRKTSVRLRKNLSEYSIHP
jgi:hypothetical protein